MTNKETLGEYAARNGLQVIVPEDAAKIRNSTSEDIVQFRFAACGHKHGHGTAIKNLKKNPAPVECKKCARVEKNRAEKNLFIDYGKNQLECGDCARLYQRCEKTLIKSLKEFKCYCKLQRENEAAFYDRMVEHFGIESVRRSFAGYGTGKNNSGDLTLLRGGKIFILDLDDKSHTCKKNQDSDITKIRAALGLGLTPIHVEQEYFLESPEVILNTIERRILEDDAMLRKVFLISKEGDSFYNYITRCEDIPSEHWGGVSAGKRARWWL